MFSRAPKTGALPCQNRHSYASVLLTSDHWRVDEFQACRWWAGLRDDVTQFDSRFGDNSPRSCRGRTGRLGPAASADLSLLPGWSKHLRGKRHLPLRVEQRVFQNPTDGVPYRHRISNFPISRPNWNSWRSDANNRRDGGGENSGWWLTTITLLCDQAASSWVGSPREKKSNSSPEGLNNPTRK